MGDWVKAGPIEVYLPSPDDEVRPEHRDTAIALTIHRRRTIQVWDDSGPGQIPAKPNARLVTALPCSPEEWAEFINAVKAGKFDLR